MCGITGFVDLRAERTAGDLSEIATRMATQLLHRGPDDSGAWVEAETGVALGFRRLAIIDLTPTGAQPMVSADRRFVLVFNGEIYNHHELRGDLERAGISLRGRSDSEVLLEFAARFGPAETLRRANGMFAFALWNREERVLHLARDRMGEKPLYYGIVRDSLVFASELKAFRPVPWFSGEVDRAALAAYLRHGYVPAPWSIHRGIAKLPAGTHLELRLDELARSRRLPEPLAYWTAADALAAGVADPLAAGDDEAVGLLDSLLRDAVALRMEADVPLGAFLSGGIDSTTVVALMQAQSERPVRTFTIGSPDAGYDEAQAAKAVAAHLGTDHTELYVSGDDALDVVPRLPELYDEPFGDSSQIPTFLVAGLARRHVTVSLSGDGGDELFGGYNRYVYAPAVWRRIGGVPAGLRRAGGNALAVAPPGTYDQLYRIAERALPARARQRMPGDKLHKLGGVLGCDGPEEIYRALVSQWPRPETLARGATEVRAALPPFPAEAAGRSPEALAAFTRWMGHADMVTYLPDDILAKVDRASMGVSLEARVPLLDHRVVEFSARVPMAMKVRDGQGKWLLRQVLFRYVPAPLVERPKMGFGLDVGAWLRGPLRDWAEGLLGEARLRDEGYLEPGPIRRALAEHQPGRRNNAQRLWAVLMFQSWLEHWSAQPVARAVTTAEPALGTAPRSGARLA
jgi:asparagine synthase (glutamine-hydrolysing)